MGGEGGNLCVFECICSCVFVSDCVGVGVFVLVSKILRKRAKERDGE